MTLSQDKKFRPKTPYIKRLSYDVVLYSPKLAEDSVARIRRKFKRAKGDERRQIIEMLRIAAAIAMSNARDNKRYTRAQREKFMQVAIMYKALRRDLENEL